MQRTELKADLQVHPFFDAYNLEAILEAMQNNNVDIVGLMYYNQLAHPEVQKRAEELAKFTSEYKADSDSLAVIVTTNTQGEFYFPASQEVKTAEDWHLLVIGYPKPIPENTKTEEAIATALDKEALVIFDHPFCDAVNPRKDIIPEREKELRTLCEKYQVALEWNGYCIPLFRKLLGAGDVNKKLEHFARTLKEPRPIVPTTDIHARNKRLLNAIGDAHITFQTGAMNSGEDLIRLLKGRIMHNNYTPEKNYVSKPHFIKAFGLPMIAGRLGISTPRVRG